MKNRSLFYALPRLILVALLTHTVIAQSPPQLTVDARAYNLLVPPGTKLTAANCQPADPLCLANAAHSPAYTLFQQPSAFATDTLGDIFVADNATGQIVKITPSGKAITVIAGSLTPAAYGFPPTTAPAVKIGLTHPIGLAVDLGGNLYIADSAEEPVFGFGSLIRIDSLGIATRLTATYTLNPADPTFLDNAAAKTQLLDPIAVATDSAGNAYVADRFTCTIREFTPSTGLLKVIAGTLATGCGSASAPSTGQTANTYPFASITGVAVGSDSTVYVTDSTYSKLFSVTSDGLLHVLAGTGSKHVIAGPSASTGDIGEPYAGLAVDGSGGVYFASLNTSALGYALIEVTHGTTTSPSQVIPLSGPYTILNGFTDANALPGAPAKLSGLNGYAGLGLDPFGRILLPTPAGDGIAFLDRNGSTILTPTTGSHALLTYTNTGGSTLTGTPYAGTAYPFSISPAPSEITAASAPPFHVDLTQGTCPTKLSGTFSLAPGESCTLSIAFTANPHVPSFGSITFYSNDPSGPVTTLLSATPVIGGQSTTPPQFSISSLSALPTTSTSRTSTFTINTAVTSAVSNGQTTQTTTPTGTVLVGLTYATNAAVIQYQTATPDSSGHSTFTFNAIPSGNYTILLQAVYEGAAATLPAYSPVLPSTSPTPTASTSPTTPPSTRSSPTTARPHSSSTSPRRPTPSPPRPSPKTSTPETPPSPSRSTPPAAPQSPKPPPTSSRWTPTKP